MRRTVLGAACWVALAAGSLAIGACSSDPIVLTVMVPDDPISPDGKTGAKVEVRVTRGGEAVNTGTASFSSSLDGTQFDSPIEDVTVMPGSDAQQVEVSISAGTASAKLYSIAKGTAKVIVTFTDSDSGTVTTATKNISFGSTSTGTTVASIRFMSAEPASLLLQNSGGQTTSQVIFQVLDSANAPVRDAEIDFELGAELGGAKLDPTTAKTSDTGMVTTTLSSGSTYGMVRVMAYTKDRGISGQSDSISIAGSAPNHKHFDFACAYPAIGGFFADGLRMGCTARIADRSSQKVPNVQVTFETEAGAIDRFVVTDEFGDATAEHKTQRPYPVDVAPNLAYMPSSLTPSGASEEPMQACRCTEDETKTCDCNPRDGLVTLIAVTAGEEEWTDSNEDGIWNNSERFVDLPEPYVDANDNGKFDPLDRREADLYIDANKNGEWDDKNGQWDGGAQIWRATKIVWTGGVHSSGTESSGIYNANADTQISTINVGHCGQTPIRVLMVDKNLNRLVSHDGDSVTCECFGGMCSPFPADIQLGDGGGGKHFWGFQIKDAHVCSDEPEPGTDNVSCTGVFTQDAEGTETIEFGLSFTAEVD